MGKLNVFEMADVETNYIFIAVFYVNNIYYYVIENECIKIKFLGDKYWYKNSDWNIWKIF